MNSEVINSFLNAAMFSDVEFKTDFMPIFRNKNLYDKVSDEWLSSLLNLSSGIAKLSKDGGWSAVDEKELAELVWSKHNGGKFRRSKIPSYMQATRPVFQRIFCLSDGDDKNGGKISI